MSDIIISDNYTRAYSLDKKIKANAQILQDTIFELGKSLLEMRDGKLYKELGYQNFAEYCENEVGMKRTQAYTYITIADNLSEDFVQSTEQIGTQKLYLLSRLDEVTRNEIVKNTDVSGTSVRELKEKISDLKKANERLMTKISEEQAKSQKLEESESRAYGKVSILETDNEFYRGKISQLESEIKNKNDSISTLESTIDELENRPIEVAISETESHEIENLKDAMKRVDLDWSQKYSELQEETTKEVIENNRKHNAEIEKLKAEYENKLKSVPTETVTDTKEIFKAYFSNATDSLNRLMDFIENHSEDNNIPFYLSKADGIIDIFNKRRNLLSGKEE